MAKGDSGHDQGIQINREDFGRVKGPCRHVAILMAGLTTPRSLPESSSDSEASIHSSDSSDEEPIPSRPSFDGSPTNVSASDDDMFVQVEYEEEREDPLDEQSASTAPNMDEDLLDPDWATLPSSVEACWEVLRQILVGYELVRPDAKAMSSKKSNKSSPQLVSRGSPLARSSSPE